MSTWINSKNNVRLLGAVPLTFISTMMMAPAALGQTVSNATPISGDVDVETAQTNRGGSALRIWHDNTTNSSLSRRLGSFETGDKVSVSLWFRADENIFGELFLGNAGGQGIWAVKEGNGHWQSLTAGWTMTSTADMWLYLYGNASGSSPNATDSVLYDKVGVTSAYQGQIWVDSFEDVLTLTADPTHLDHWHTAGQRTELVTQSTTNTYNGHKAVRIRRSSPTNSSLSIYVGEFEQGDTVFVTLWFRADEDVFGELSLSNAGDQGVWAGEEGNGDWQRLTASWTMTSTDDMWLYIYGNASGSDPDDITSVIYDDVAVASSQHGLIWVKGFENGLLLTDDHFEDAAWYSDGQPNEILTAPGLDVAVHGSSVVRSREVG